MALPLDFFTFRSWEALSPYQLTFDGRFYPNQRLITVEEGDIAPRTVFSIPKSVIFETDAFGFRYDGTAFDFDIVIVGDSMATGSSLTQTDMLSERLEAQSDLNVYTYAPVSSVEQYVSDPRFVENPPDIVIVAMAERNFLRLCHNDQSPMIRGESAPSSLFTELQITLDLLMRRRFYLEQYLIGIETERQIYVDPATQMVFDRTYYLYPYGTQEIVMAMENCREWIEAMGSEMIFIPLPDRTRIYHQLLSDDLQQTLTRGEPLPPFENVILQTQDAGIDTIDLLTPYLAASTRQEIIYQLDDTHWNPRGVQIAATIILDYLWSDQEAN